ncbi:hypothetical protein SAMN05421505_108162 [Sinosporangium album]|uniref:Uncharacterized protein n=1 Tax=Sinosporangium album TaxID=504805 RepID=A0A1G7XF68_9ACTN|nr:hypothetical protein [Sinosporangium album]SDG82776.1 hypothetical protein SAMN05421505_108162 [Sinosporangium album]
MSIEWVNQVVDDLRAWGRSRGLDVDVDEIRLLCDYASDYLGVNQLGDFTADTFEELLLSIYPRKVIAPPESASETVAAARTLVDFLLDSGHSSAELATGMRARLDGIEPEMPDALADTSRYGMAKSMFSAIGPESLEQPDTLVIPSGEAELLAETPCECPACAPLPPVRLAPPAELAAAARKVPLLADLHTLIAWMRDSERTPTVKGALRVKDAAHAPVPRPALLWDLARGLGEVETSRASMTVRAGFAPPAERDDDDLLAMWADTVGLLVEADAGGAVTGAPVLDRELYDLLHLLYRLQVPVPTATVLEYLDELGEETGGLDIGGALDRLAYCGLVARRGDTFELTPLALWALRRLYLGLGMEAPEAEDLAEADAVGLIEGLLSGVPTELAERDIDAWLERRDPGRAAAELLGAAAGAPAVARGIAMTIVDRLPAEAEPAVRAALDESELRPHAIHWLAARGLPAPALTQAELLWMSVDMLALAMPAAEEDPENFSENMAASGPPAHMIEEMWRVDHPDVVAVLELLGRSLADPDVAKAARKAAFKARSRAIG